MKSPVEVVFNTNRFCLSLIQQGWRGNIRERAEDEMSYTTSFACPSNRFVPRMMPAMMRGYEGVLGDDGVSVVSRRSFYPNTNWTTLPFGEEDEDN